MAHSTTATEMRVDSSLLSSDASTCFRRVESLAIGRVEILVDVEWGWSWERDL